MDERTPVNERIAAAVRSLRRERGLSLAALATSSGVGRSTLSLIERGEASPTATVLDKVAAGLGVPLATLFGDAAPAVREPVARRREQAVWRDPGSGYLRRTVSPAGITSPIRLAEVTFPAGARVVFDTGRGDRTVHQQLWVLAGTIDFTLGDETHRLHAGDCIACTLDRATAFHNPTDRAARYAVVSVGTGPR